MFLWIVTAALAFIFLSLYLDDYEDIIPNSLRPSDEDIHRMVHFWDMDTKPLESESEFEFGPILTPVEDLGNVLFECLWLCFDIF